MRALKPIIGIALAPAAAAAVWSTAAVLAPALGRFNVTFPLLCGVAARQSMRKQKRLADTETSRIGRLRAGFAEVKGRARPARRNSNMTPRRNATRSGRW